MVLTLTELGNCLAGDWVSRAECVELRAGELRSCPCVLEPLRGSL